MKTNYYTWSTLKLNKSNKRYIHYKMSWFLFICRLSKLNKSNKRYIHYTMSWFLCICRLSGAVVCYFESEKKNRNKKMLYMYLYVIVDFIILCQKSCCP
jgi:hypothetical protein